MVPTKYPQEQGVPDFKSALRGPHKNVKVGHDCNYCFKIRYQTNEMEQMPLTTTTSKLVNLHTLETY